jgi:aspartokinase/homoserine dehydrogenase 1
VRGLEHARHLRHEPAHVLERERAALSEPRGERLTLDELEHEEGRTVARLASLVDAHRVRVLHASGELCLAPQALARPSRLLPAEELHGDPTEARVLRQPDGAHASRAELADHADLVVQARRPHGGGRRDRGPADPSACRAWSPRTSRSTLTPSSPARGHGPRRRGADPRYASGRMRSSILVHKFGGTSVAGADRYRNVARIVTSTPHAEHAGARRTQGVVVSAMSKVTDGLLDLVSRAKQRDDTYAPALEALLTRHRDTAAELLPRAEAERLAEVFARDGRDLADVLRAVWLGRGASELTEELVSGYGELWSAQLLSAHLAAEGHDAAWLDAREVLVVSTSAHSTTSESGPRIDWALSEKRLGDWRAAHPAALVVITGFIAATREGVPTTLKRNGSRLLGEHLRRAVRAPRRSSSGPTSTACSRPIRGVCPRPWSSTRCRYDEACELAYFGAKVLHPRTMEPAVARDPDPHPQHLRPRAPRLVIASRERRPRGASRAAPSRASRPFDGIALVNLEGSGMIGVPGVAERLFGALREVGVSVVLISQGSSEHSICFAVPESHGGVAREVSARLRAGDRRGAAIQRWSWCRARAILAAVGDGMAHSPGVAATFFSSLAKAGVSVRAIAQGSSERNISAVIDRADSTRALRAVHAGFVLSERVLSVGLVGGPRGQARSSRSSPSRRPGAARDAAHRPAPARRGGQQAHGALETGLDLRSAADRARGERHAARPRRASRPTCAPPHLPHAVIDRLRRRAKRSPRATSRWLAAGLHVVTPNKRAGAGSLARYRALRAHEARGRSLALRGHGGARACPSSRRCATSCGPAIASRRSRACSRARSRTSSTCGTARALLRGGARRQDARLHRARPAR